MRLFFLCAFAQFTVKVESIRGKQNTETIISKLQKCPQFNIHNISQILLTLHLLSNPAVTPP